VEAVPADCVVVSAPLPVSASLYQASKLVPPAGILLREGGTVVVAAECPEGTGPLAVVNEKIFDLGVRRYLPERYRLFLVSAMDEATVSATYATFAPSVGWALEQARSAAGVATLDVAVLPDAGDVVPRPIG
jgi:nickel-dependent lactate racemase